MHFIVPFHSLPRNNSLCVSLRPTESDTVYNTWHCVVSTLNELIAYNEDEFNKEGRASSTVNIAERRVLLQPGIHHVSKSTHSLWSGKRASTLNITGSSVNDVTIFCNVSFNFQFSESTNITINNIHFKNCRGVIAGHYSYKATLTFGLNIERANITLNSIKITAKNSIGIMLYATKYQNFTLINSILSTSDTGVYLFNNSLNEAKITIKNDTYCKPPPKPRRRWFFSEWLWPSKPSQPSCSTTYTYKYGVINHVNITNTYFQKSCLILYTKQWTYQYTVANATFIGCTCSPVLSVHGRLMVTLNDVTVRGSESNLLLYTTAKSLKVEGIVNFHNNSGGMKIYSSNMNFTGALISFIANMHHTCKQLSTSRYGDVYR